MTVEEARKDNEKRKREVTGKDRKQGILTGLDLQTSVDAVDSNTQAEFKSPAEYVRMAHEEDRQLTSEEFMQATELSLSADVLSIVFMVL